MTQMLEILFDVRQKLEIRDFDFIVYFQVPNKRMNCD
jgi:hypothetical protein